MTKRRLTTLQKFRAERDVKICELYLSGKYTTQKIAANFHVSPRGIQRVVKHYGVGRTQAEANRVAAPLKNYYRMPKELKVVRKHLTNKRRYELINAQPWCTTCGARPADGVRLEVDHIDNDPKNNDAPNLQVLCNLCNLGKSHLDRFGPSGPGPL